MIDEVHYSNPMFRCTSHKRDYMHKFAFSSLRKLNKNLRDLNMTHGQQVNNFVRLSKNKCF